MRCSSRAVVVHVPSVSFLELVVFDMREKGSPLTADILKEPRWTPPDMRRGGITGTAAIVGGAATCADIETVLRMTAKTAELNRNR
jgi:hypothetical protein